MAELGIVASGMGIASLALQVGDCIVKLKEFWDAVKDAPEEIKYLMEEIETLSLVLSGFEASDQAGLNVGTESTSRSLHFCQKAASILSSVVKEAENEIKKRRLLGSLKTVVKKDAIEKLRERLMAAQSMLMLSNQFYILELQKRNQQVHHNWAQTHQQELQLLRASVTQSTQTFMSSMSFQSSSKQALKTSETISSSYQSKSPTENNAPERKHQNFKNNSKRQLQLKARFLIPKWLFGVSRAVEIYESRAQAGWNFNIQVYNVVPSRSPIFKMATRGDVVGIQQLFSTGQATPFDRDQYGKTVLDMAVDSRKLKICRLLINEGADPNISSRSSALFVACEEDIFWGAPQSNLELVQLLAQHTEIPNPFEKDNFYFCGFAEVFTWLLQHSNSMYQPESLEERVLFIIKICNTFQPDMAGLVKTILKLKVIDATVCCISDDSRNTLLHRAAENLGCILSSAQLQGMIRFEDLLDLVGELVKGGSQLYALTLWGRTPMSEVISAMVYFGSMLSDLEVEVNKVVPLRAWLKQLKNSGVDLVEYGKEEKRVLESPDAVREYVYCVQETWDDSQVPWHYLRLINFTYGPEPVDWTFWFVPVMEDYFMDFWDMIDHPERGMPGAWED